MVDYGFFEALTGPMQTAGAIQDNRDKAKLDQLRLQQYQQQQQILEMQKNEALQTQANQAQQDAINIIYQNNNFKRPKDLHDYKDWHTNESGWKDILEILKKAGSVDNAMLNYNLSEALNAYKLNVKNNPISKRVNENLENLKEFKQYQNNPVEGKMLTKNSLQKFEDYKNGKTDVFTFNGARGDYLNEAKEILFAGDNITLDDILYGYSKDGKEYAGNYSRILVDYLQDTKPDHLSDEEYLSMTSDSDLENWLKRELSYNQDSQGVGYFNGVPLYGEKKNKETFSQIITNNLNAGKATGFSNLSTFFNLRDQGVSFKNVFEGDVDGIPGASHVWQRYGGYDPTQTTKSYKGALSAVTPGRQMVAGGRIMAFDKRYEDLFTKSWAGQYDDGNSKYMPKNRTIYDVNMAGKYDSFGKMITNDQTTSRWEIAQLANEESERMDLKLNGYFIGLQAVNKDGESFLLTDFSSEKDMDKIKAQYKDQDVQFKQVILAELEDVDFGTPNDAYYHVIDMTNLGFMESLNQNIPTTNMNNIIHEGHEYEQEQQMKKQMLKRKQNGRMNLAKQLLLPNDAAVDEVINTYDNVLTVGLSTAGVSSTKIQQAIPMLIADLAVLSQQERDYPVDFGDGMVANNSSQYMAYSTQKLKAGLVNDPTFFEMLKSIQEGNYDAYRIKTMDGKLYKKSKELSKNIYNFR